MGKFTFAGPVATGLNLGKREYNEAIFTSVAFQRLHTELEEKFSFSKFVFWIQSYCMSLVSANALVTHIAEAFILTQIWNFVLFKSNYWQDERKI